MKICIFRIGAIGGYLAGELALAGHEVCAIAPAVLDAIRDDDAAGVAAGGGSALAAYLGTVRRLRRRPGRTGHHPAQPNVSHASADLTRSDKWQVGPRASESRYTTAMRRYTRYQTERPQNRDYTKQSHHAPDRSRGAS